MALPGDRVRRVGGILAGVSTSASVLVRRVEIVRRTLGERIRRWAWGAFAAGSALTGAGFTAYGLVGAPSSMHASIALSILLGIAAIYLSPLVFVAGLVAGRRRALLARALHVEGRQLVVEDTSGARIPFAGPYRQGVVVPGGLVVEGASGRELHATLEGAVATAVIDALDLEAAKRRFTFRWQSDAERVFSWIAGTLGFGALASLPVVLVPTSSTHYGAAMGCAMFSMPVVFSELASRFWAQRSLSIGLDGLEAQSRRGKRLVRFADVASVTAEGGSELLVTLRDGTEHRFFADPKYPAERAAIEDRIREAMAVARSKEGQGSLAGALLERAGRTLPEWRDAAARLLTAATGFRDATIGAEELGAVLDDASAPAEQRVAAAIALAHVVEHRARVRVAADTAVSPKLRIALEGLAEGRPDDEALAAALAEHAQREEASKTGARPT